MILINPTTKGEVYGIREVVDLMHNGYYILWSSGTEGNMSYRLRHPKNGRILTAHVRYDRFTLREGYKVLKDVILPLEVISD